MIDGLQNLFDKMMTLALDVLFIMNKTVDLLNGIDFENSVVANYMGYARYVFGGPLWFAFTTVLLIPLGVTIYIYILKGIGYIRQVMNW